MNQLPAEERGRWLRRPVLAGLVWILGFDDPALRHSSSSCSNASSSTNSMAAPDSASGSSSGQVHGKARCPFEPGPPGSSNGAGGAHVSNFGKPPRLTLTPKIVGLVHGDTAGGPVDCDCPGAEPASGSHSHDALSSQWGWYVSTTPPQSTPQTAE